MYGKVMAICIAPSAGSPMKAVEEVQAIAGIGLSGDRYASGQGSFNKGRVGSRQVTLINGIFFVGTAFDYLHSRRNIVTVGVELMWLVGREFRIGEARFRGIKYCDPCDRPSNLWGVEESFKQSFYDRGGLIAEVIETGDIKVGDLVTPPAKGY